MSKSDYWENALLDLLFNATPVPNIADNAVTSPLTQLYVSLHESDPQDAGNQETGETGYTGYSRVAVLRTSAGWTITNNSVSPNNDIDFGNVTAGSGTISHVVIGTDASGPGRSLYHGVLTPPINYSPGTTPKVTAGSTITED